MKVFKGLYLLNFFKKNDFSLDVFWYFKLRRIPLCYLFLLFKTYSFIFYYKIESRKIFLSNGHSNEFTCFKPQYYTRKSSFYLFSMVENPVKPRITKSRKNLDKQDKIDLEKQKLSSGLQNWQLTLNSRYPYEKDLHELNKEQRLIKWRKGFLGVGRQLLNNVNTGINFSTADNESKNGNLNT